MNHPRVDKFFSTLQRWKKEMERLRSIVLECGLTEELKWGQPCYTFENRNILIIHGFKEYCAILFVKGALMSDSEGILIQQTKNVQAGRHIRFTNVREILELEPVLKRYIYEAIEVERAGLKVAKKKTSDFPVPEELSARFEKDPALNAAFRELTPGRQRAYLLYFAQPKQSKTREARIDKSRQLILDGKGLQDDYLRDRKK